MSEDSDGNEWDLLLPPDFDVQLESALESLAGDDDDHSAPWHHTHAAKSSCRRAVLCHPPWLPPRRADSNSGVVMACACVVACVDLRANASRSGSFQMSGIPK